MKTFRNLAILFFLFGVGSAVAGTPTFVAQPSPAPTDENSNDLFLARRPIRSTVISPSPKLGHGNSLYNDFSYDHRFLITGKWYLRLGVEYERYDFDGTNNGLPDHLQAATGHIALEYVVKDFPGISLELDPGVYFQDNATWNAFDVPGKFLFRSP